MTERIGNSSAHSTASSHYDSSTQQCSLDQVSKASSSQSTSLDTSAASSTPAEADGGAAKPDPAVQQLLGEHRSLAARFAEMERQQQAQQREACSSRKTSAMLTCGGAAVMTVGALASAPSTLGASVLLALGTTGSLGACHHGISEARRACAEGAAR